MSINIILDSTSEHLKDIFNPAYFRVFISAKNKDKKYSFPDGEVYARLDSIAKIKGRTVIIHSGAPNPSKGLVELEMLLALLKGKGARPLEVFFTYFPYGQQDKSFLAGEVNMAKNILDKLVNYYKVARIYIIDPHFGHRAWLKNYPVKKIFAFKLFKDIILEKYPEILFLSADSGQSKRSGISGAKKKRLNSFKVKFELGQNFKKVKGKNICIVDDLIETGGTLSQLSGECRKIGAKKVVVFVTHGVLNEGINRVSLKADEFYLANTIRHKKANVNINQLIIDSLRQ